MENELIAADASSHGRWLQAVYYNDASIAIPGLWDPKKILAVLTTGLSSEAWRGKRVLDIGACNGGLSIELARLGAVVHAVEPNPQAIGQFEFARDSIADIKGLNIVFEKGTLFTLDRSQEYDIVLFLGLLYHFRYPQLILDYLAAFRADVFFISSQTHKSNDLVMLNRKNIVSDYGKRILAGYHPSRKLMRAMIEWAGFSRIEEIITTDTGRDFEDRKTNITNSAYFMARQGVHYEISDLQDFYI